MQQVKSSSPDYKALERILDAKDDHRCYLDSMVYTCIYLTGDYPIITYTLSARAACFFMVITAVVVVSVFSAIIATGFTQIAQSRSKAKRSNESLLASNDSCDDEDWYEQQLKLLKSNNTGPPPSRFGSVVDYWQIQVNELLNGKEDAGTGAVTWTSFSFSIRMFRLLVIIANVVTVVLETIPEIDKKMGISRETYSKSSRCSFFRLSTVSSFTVSWSSTEVSSNYLRFSFKKVTFDSLAIFFVLYVAMRLFSARKNRNSCECSDFMFYYFFLFSRIILSLIYLSLPLN